MERNAKNFGRIKGARVTSTSSIRQEQEAKRKAERGKSS